MRSALSSRGAQRTSQWAHGGAALDQRAQPRCETLVALEARRGGCVERGVHLQEAAHQFAIRHRRLGKRDVVGERDILVTGQGRQGGDLYHDEARCPGPAPDRLAVMRARGIPSNELPRLYEAALRAAARTHRLPGDDPEDVLAAWLDGVVAGLAPSSAVGDPSLRHATSGPAQPDRRHAPSRHARWQQRSSPPIAGSLRSAHVDYSAHRRPRRRARCSLLP